MKRCLRACALLLVSCLLFLASCGETYEPQKSTDEESATVLSLTYGKKTYEIPMELYRAFYLTYRDDCEGEELVERVYDRITDMYAVFALCDEYGIRTNDKTAKETVQECIRQSIAGDGTEENPGYGTYEAFLKSLTEQHLTYAVFDLICRYTLAEERLNDYLFGTVNEKTGEAENVHRTVSESEARSYIESEDTTRVLMAKLTKAGFTELRAQELYGGLCLAVNNAADAAAAETAAANYLIGHTAAVGNEIEAGVWISRHNLDRTYYAELIDAILDTPDNTVVPLMLVTGGDESAYYLVYRTNVTSDMFETHEDDVYEAVKAEIFGKTIADTQAALRASLTVVSTPVFEGK